MKRTPFWTENFPRPADLPVATLPRQVDVAVVGAGYTGLSAARSLALEGARVVVLEQGQVGAGASSVNGGQTGPGLKKSVPALIKAYGPSLGRELWHASVEAAHYLEQVIQEEQIECDYRRSGSLALAYRPAHYQLMVRKAEWMLAELGHELRLIPGEKLGEEIGSSVFYGGLLEPLGGGLHPARYVYGLARAAAGAGAVLCENAGVRSFSRQPYGFQVQTSQGSLKARDLLLATNGYTGGLAPQVRRYVFAVGSYMITTEPLSPALQQSLIPHGRVMYDTKNFLNYFRLTPDGRLAMGGRNNLSPELDVVESAKNLQQTMVHIFPQLHQASISHTWTGRLGFTFDLLPHMGRLAGVHYALGYSGHGVTLATYLGREIARFICGQAANSPFAEIKPLTHFFYHQRPWFLPLAAAYYRFLDRIS